LRVLQGADAQELAEGLKGSLREERLGITCARNNWFQLAPNDPPAGHCWALHPRWWCLGENVFKQG